MSEQNETQSGGQYAVPDVEQVELMDAGEAEKRLRELDSARRRDSTHPSNTKADPLHKDYLDYEMALRTKAAEGRENPCDVAMREFDAEQEKKQAKLRVEAEKLLDEMGENEGFTGRDRLDAALDDVQPWKLDLWKMQSLNQKRDFKRLLPMLEQHVQKLRLDGVEAFRSLLWDEKASKDDKSAMIAMLLERVWNASEKKFSADPSLGFGGVKRQPKTEEQTQ
jgi:hypothetical protein